ncbi:MAG: DMT family transporter, partial [Ardenticatenaceae bacterium]
RGGKLKSTWAEWRPYIFIGLFDNAVPGVLTSWGQLHIDSGLTTILLALAPLFTVFLAHYFSDNDKLNSQKTIGITLGLLGTLILVGPSALRNVGANLWGQLAIIASALCFAVTAIYVRTTFQKKSESPLDSALETLTHQLFMSTLFLVPFAWVIDSPWTLQPSLASMAALLASGWGISITAMLIYYYIINTIGASVASSTLYLIPINGVFWGAMLLSEPVTWSMI